MSGALQPNQVVEVSNNMRLCTQWRDTYPLVVEAMSTGLAAELLPNLVEKTYVVPITDIIPIDDTVMRSKTALKAAIREAMMEKLKNAAWENPELTHQIANRVAEGLQTEIDDMIKEAEADRSFGQWLRRVDVTNNMQIQALVYHSVLVHESFVAISGQAKIRREKAALTELSKVDVVHLEMTLKLNMLTVDKEKMTHLNSSEGLRRKLAARDPLDDLLA